MKKWMLLLCMTWFSLLLAQVRPTQADTKLDVFSKPVAQLTEADLKQFVALGFAEKITVVEVQKLYEQLTFAQKEIVFKAVAEEAGISLDEWEQERKTHQMAQQNFHGATPNAEIWRQFVENTWTWGLPAGSTFANYYYTDKWCETTQPTDPDTDYVFHFNMTYSANPDGLRWTSQSSQVYLAFMSAYGGNLNGFSASWSNVKLCIGENGVWAAGGAANVKNNIFVHPNN